VSDPAGEWGHIAVGLVAEDNAHVLLVQTLAYRVAVEHVHWLDAETLAVMCRWIGPRGHDDFKLPKDLEFSASGRKLRIHGKIGGEPLRPEAGMYRRILVAFEQLASVPEIVIIARDGDGRAEQRRSGFHQVVEGQSWSFPVILAMPEPESEAWIICGFEPETDLERRRYEELLRGGQLSFDPVREPHRLTSRPNDAPTDAKRVEKALMGSDGTRRAACLAIPLAMLAQRGDKAGLARFIDDLRRIFVPLVDPSSKAR
jgi:hypothetical protein